MTHFTAPLMADVLDAYLWLTAVVGIPVIVWRGVSLVRASK